MMEKIFAVALGADYVEFRACTVKPVKKRSRVVLEYKAPARIDTIYDSSIGGYRSVKVGGRVHQYSLSMASHLGGRVLTCMHRSVFAAHYPAEHTNLKTNGSLLLTGAAAEKAKQFEREWSRL